MRILAAFATVSLLASAQISHAAASLAFTTIDNPGDPTFNQLLGINNKGTISGYFGSGAAGHPNQAYTIAAPYTQFAPANVQGSVQTQATAINSAGTIAGFWSDTNTGMDANFGFIRWKDGAKFRYLQVNDPLVGSSPLVNQVLGLNSSEIAAGFYVDANGASHGYTYTVSKAQFKPVNVGGSVADSATGINNLNLICGFYIDSGNVTHGFLKPLSGGQVIRFTVPGAAVTQFLGVNDRGEAVGFYQMTSTSNPVGLLYNPASGAWMPINDPDGVGGTVVNGLNDKGELVGFYTDAAGNVHGMLVTGAP